jgi:hypothetical protein
LRPTLLKNCVPSWLYLLGISSALFVVASDRGFVGAERTG